MTRWMDSTRFADVWPDAWIIEEQSRREREREERRERAWLELPLEAPDDRDPRAPEGERPSGGAVITLDL